MASELPISSAAKVLANRISKAIEDARSAGKYGNLIIDMRFVDGEVADVKVEDHTRIKFTARME